MASKKAMFGLGGLLLGIIFMLFLPSVMADPGTAGGTLTYDGSFSVRTFLSNSTFGLNETIYNTTILIVGGGGGSGVNGGGGGGGGVYLVTSYNITSNTSVKVGAGGPGGGCNDPYVNDGQNSSFGTLIGVGGGGGANGCSLNAHNGGSGGGGGDSETTAGYGGNGTTGQGNKGGNNFPGSKACSGGGGGAGQPGTNATNSGGGNGGNGTSINMNGTAVYYGGGGGGMCYYSNPNGLGGLGGGADGVRDNNAGKSGTNGLGGGAGGYGGGSAGNGGSGIVIVRYKTNNSEGPPPAVPLPAVNVTIQSPTNTTYNYTTPISISLNYSVAGNVSMCWYSLDGAANSTLASCANGSFSLSTAGSHNVFVYANNTENLVSSAGVSFSLNFIPPPGPTPFSFYPLPDKVIANTTLRLNWSESSGVNVTYRPSRFNSTLGLLNMYSPTANRYYDYAASTLGNFTFGANATDAYSQTGALVYSESFEVCEIYFNCSHFQSCRSDNITRCLEVTDFGCDTAYSGNLSDFDQDCAYVPPDPTKVDLLNFDLNIERNMGILALMIFLWVALAVLEIISGNFLFKAFFVVVGVVLMFMTFTISWVISIAFAVFSLLGMILLN
jgi:hypothetical protein